LYQATIYGYEVAQNETGDSDIAGCYRITVEPGEYNIAPEPVSQNSLSAPKPNISIGIPMPVDTLAEVFSADAIRDILRSPVARQLAPFDKTTGSLYGCWSLWNVQIKRKYNIHNAEIALNQNANTGSFDCVTDRDIQVVADLICTL
jgi:hypothetical protein